MNNETVSPTEFARTYNISRQTVLRWCAQAVKRGETWAWKAGGRWRIDAERALIAISRLPVRVRGNRRAVKRVKRIVWNAGSADAAATR